MSASDPTRTQPPSSTRATSRCDALDEEIVQIRMARGVSLGRDLTEFKMLARQLERELAEAKGLLWAANNALGGQAALLAEKDRRIASASPSSTRATEAEASSACPMCGVDTPHAHGEQQVVEWLRLQAVRFYPDGDIQISGQGEVGLVLARLVEDGMGRHYLLPPEPRPYRTMDSDQHERLIRNDPEVQKLLSNGNLHRDSMRITPLYAAAKPASATLEGSDG